MEQGIPAWSGEFWTQGSKGFLAVHLADERHHRPPTPGWKLVRTDFNEDDNAEVYIYRRVTT